MITIPLWLFILLVILASLMAIEIIFILAAVLAIAFTPSHKEINKNED